MGKLGARVLVGIPTLASARRSVEWIDAMANLQLPLGSSMARVWIEDETIAQAREQLAQKALELGCDYLFFLGDDVLPPPNCLLQMLDKIGRDFPVGEGQVARASMVTGVYWTKAYPSEPYLWQGLLQGSYRSWTAGEFFPIDLAGCDCLLVETEMLRQLPRPWFSTEWTWRAEQPPSSIATEDFYFFTKARRAGFRLFADTQIQCLHEDRQTGHFYGLTADMPQAGGQPEGGLDELLVAEVGAGTDSPAWGPGCRVVRFDLRPDVRPDVRCDIRNIPADHFGRYDVVHTRHVLEHFGVREAPELVRHWARLLKPGGRLVVRVPNLGWAMRKILDEDASHGRYPWQQIYGGQHYPLDFHRNGFTAKKLAALLRTHPLLERVEVREEDEGQNLRGEAVLARADQPESIGQWWDEIRQAEAAAVVVDAAVDEPAPEPAQA